MTTPRKDPDAPLASVRVLNLGTRWPGRVAAMLLADQGADVVEIVRPGREPHAVDPLLDRGKRLVEMDLRDEAARSACRARAAEADVVLENMRPGAAAALGLDYAGLDGPRRGLVYVSLPGFAEGDPLRSVPAWEGVIDGSVGVYTNISPLGALLGAPVYSAIPMASAYGGVLGSLAASLGLYHRQRTGRGQHVEAPLADCVMAAMALLACRIEGQPSRYNFPTIDNAVLDLLFPALRALRGRLTEEHVAQVAEYVRGHANPTINFYECADGRILFVCAPDHVYQNRAFLQVLGVYDQVIAEGMVSETPYVEHDAGNNVNKGASLTPAWRERLIGLIAAAAKARPAAEWEARLREANVPAAMVRTSAEWLADPALRAAGVTTDLDCPGRGPVRLPGRFLSIEGGAVRSPALRAGTAVGEGAFEWKAPPLDRPVGNAALASATGAAATAGAAAPDARAGGLLEGVRVLDFSNIVAGPAAGRTLAEHGADVVRIDPPAPLAGPFATMWFGVDVNQGKRALVLDLKTEAGKAALARLVEGADVVLHNFLDRSARSLGIAHDQLAAVNPEIVSCQIGAWTGNEPGPYDGDPSFDPVLQASTGIMARYGGGPEKPALHAIASCVDYVTGFSAAAGISQALLARARGRGGSYVRTSLAMGAQLVQFPHMAAWKGGGPGSEPSGQRALGDGPGQRIYEAADGWAFVGCRPGDGTRLARAVGAADDAEGAIEEAVRALTVRELQARLAGLPGAGAAPLRTLAEIRADRTTESTDQRSNWMSSGSLRLFRGPHPSGHLTTLPMPTWIRPAASPVRHLPPAPFPGAHTAEVLAEAGHTEAEVERLVRAGAARPGWAVLPRYLPR